uniref:non-specific serine/threonine protein kinase n=1 Tax=Elaeis guineensis var. tenera TaxID=51953 RepID=A0A8N4EZ32_ELAGV|nr:probable serine/threonine-protein kinase WNK11 isoform X2 [Elaeis guineensis]
MPCVAAATVAEDKDAEPFVEVDPTGRYGRYAELLGFGAVKKVYRAFDQEEGIEVAWNQVSLRRFRENRPMMDRLFAEVHLLRELRHDNIIALYRVWTNAEQSTLNFITEVCTSGDLREYRKRHRHVSLKALKKWSRQILVGLDYLHNHDPCIIHRDLNCSNVFINGNVGQVVAGEDRGLGAGGDRGEEPRGALDTGDAGVHGAGAVRGAVHGAGGHLLVRDVCSGDGDAGDPLQRVRQHPQDLPQGYGWGAPGGLGQGP